MKPLIIAAVFVCVLCAILGAQHGRILAGNHWQTPTTTGARYVAR